MFKIDYKQAGIELALGLIVLFLVIKFAFLQESLLVVSRLSFSIWWVFILPGYIILTLFFDSFNGAEKIFLSTVLGVSIVTLFSYHLSYYGFLLNYLWYFIPVLTLMVCILVKFMIAKIRSTRNKAS